MQYHISNTTSGHDLGTFDGATALDAYQAMMRDAGYPDSDSAESAGLSWDTIPGDVAVVEVEEADDLDFAMLTPPTRPGPCRAATPSEVEKPKKVERLPPMIDRAMAYIHQHAPCSIAEVAAAITRGNSWGPAQNAVGMLWAERRIVVRDNVITLPEGA